MWFECDWHSVRLRFSLSLPLKLIYCKCFYLSSLHLLFECISCSFLPALLLNMQWHHFNIHLLCSIISFTFTYIYIKFEQLQIFCIRFVDSCVVMVSVVLLLLLLLFWWIAAIHLFRFAWLTWKFTLSINRILFFYISLLFYTNSIPKIRGWKKRPLAARKSLGNMLCIVFLLAIYRLEYMF